MDSSTGVRTLKGDNNRYATVQDINNILSILRTEMINDFTAKMRSLLQVSSSETDVEDLRVVSEENRNSVSNELPILLDTSIPDSGSNNDIKDKDTTTTELKSTLDITSSDYDIKNNKDYQSTAHPILLDKSGLDSGCNGNSSVLSNNNHLLGDSDFDQAKVYRDDVTHLDDLERFDVANESATDIFSLDSEFMYDTYVSDNKDINYFTEDSIWDEEVIFDYSNYEPQNYVETMVNDCYRCDIISLPTRDMVLVSNNTMKSASTPMYCDIKCVPVAAAGARVMPISDSMFQMANGMSFKHSKILGRTVWDPGVTIDNDTRWNC